MVEKQRRRHESRTQQPIVYATNELNLLQKLNIGGMGLAGSSVGRQLVVVQVRNPDAAKVKSRSYNLGVSWMLIKKTEAFIEQLHEETKEDLKVGIERFEKLSAFVPESLEKSS